MDSVVHPCPTIVMVLEIAQMEVMKGLLEVVVSLICSAVYASGVLLPCIYYIKKDKTV